MPLWGIKRATDTADAPGMLSSGIKRDELGANAPLVIGTDRSAQA
jgi:hypothetical protein